MLKIRDGRLLRRQIFRTVFEEPQADDGIERILTFLDNSILTAITTFGDSGESESLF